MGPQSTTTHRHTLTPLWIALVLLLLPLRAHSQTTVSATTVPLILPSAIVFDAQGNLYLAETASHVIRKVDATGIITTIVGTGTQGFSGDNGRRRPHAHLPAGLGIDLHGLAIVTEQPVSRASVFGWRAGANRDSRWFRAGTAGEYSVGSSA